MQKTKKTISISRDLELIFICAIRYCIGRRTYMPSLIQDYIKPLLPSLTDNFLEVVSQDMIDNVFWGDDCDKRDWDKFGECIAMEKERRLTASENHSTVG